jgi:hypothetical protein
LPENKDTPIIAKISQMIARTNKTFIIAAKLSNNAFTTIRIGRLWLMNLNGRSVLSNLRTFITGMFKLEIESSIIENTTIEKSNLFHESLK